MPHAKFHANPLKTVAVRKEQRTDRHYVDTQTDIFSFICIRYVHL